MSVQVRLTVIDPRRGARRVDLVLTAAPDTKVAEVRSLLMDAVDAPDDTTALFVDGQLLDDVTMVGVPPLVSGALVTVGHRGADAGRAAGRVGGFLELHVVAGPDAGHVYRLRPGRHVIGRAGEDVLKVDDPDCSRRHAELRVSATGVSVHDLGSTNGTHVDGVGVGEEGVVITERSRILLGSTTLVLRVPGAPSAATHSTGDGTLEVNRSPRISSPAGQVEIRMPQPPAPQRAVRLPVVALLLPVLVAIPMAFLWSPTALLFALMSPVMLVGNAVSDKLSGRKQYQRDLAVYHEARADGEQRVQEAVQTETVRRRSASPDPAEVLTIATVPLQRVWERRPPDAEFLVLSVGTATLPSSVSVTDTDGASTHPPLDAVPVTVPLAAVGVLGVVGLRARSVALVRWLVAQLATLHSPRDVSLVVLAAEDWSATGWLPHSDPHDLPPNPADASDKLVGATVDQVHRRVTELVATLDARLAEHRVGEARWHGPSIVVLLDGAQRLRTVPGVARLLEEGPEVGIFSICLDADAARLPVECGGTVELTGEVGTRLRVTLAGSAPLEGVVADLTSAGWLERVARGLAPLRDATPDEVDGGLPEQTRLLDVLSEEGLPDPTQPRALARAWGSSHRSTTALLGMGAAGPHRVDLRRDGPHVLVAGTTGAGKSELLQTLIASLAIVNRPDEMGFVLVDYKGGSAFADCGRLPHTLGLVTDLDEHLTRRALESLTAEVTRRERLLAQHGAKDIEDYQALVDASGQPPPGLGRLVIVIDEFRVLTEELPAFLDGLVRIAAVGRSLGIHLVLATQRPGGVVSADIKANVNLRIALRVRDATDSIDVLDVRDAAVIGDGLPGRALSRTGSSPLVEFQTARIGGHALRSAVTSPTVRPITWRTLGEPPPRPAAVSAAGPTDLARVVDAVQQATEQSHIAPTPSPWMAPLPTSLFLAALPMSRDAGGEEHVSYGLLDLPREQRQETAVFDLAAGSCLAVAGTARSGRTTLLRTLAVSAATRSTPGNVAIYALDGNGGLASLAELPSVGAVVPCGDVDRTVRLLRTLAAEVARRQELLAAAGFPDIAGHRKYAAAAGETLPYLLLLLDGWEAFQQAVDDVDGGRVVDTLHQLLRQGPGVGLLTVVTGGRAVLTGQLGSNLAHRLVLRLADPTDAVLAGVPSRELPGSLPPGRGLLVGDGTVVSVQIAQLADEPEDASEVQAVQRIAGQQRAARTGTAAPAVPFVVPPMPDRLSLADVRGDAPPRPGWLPIGVGGDDVGPVGFDLRSDGRRLVIAGHPRSGRSTALLALAHALLDDGWPVALVAPSPSPVTAWGGLAERRQPRPGAGVLGVFGPGDGDRLLTAMDSTLDAGRPAALLVDDGDQLDGSMLEPVLLKLVDRLPASGEVFVLAGSTPQLTGRFSGITVHARKGASGLLLGPAGSLDGDVLGVRTPRRPERRPGRGILVRRGEMVAVQVAQPPTHGQEDA
jgi:DNA segregation ATPase FtsK/SpoIIIE, S-DNA-T family